MLEFWDSINDITTIGQFIEWFKLQGWGMKIFLSAVGLSILYTATFLVLTLIPFGRD
jgi:hypothetical protein